MRYRMKNSFRDHAQAQRFAVNSEERFNPRAMRTARDGAARLAIVSAHRSTVSATPKSRSAKSAAMSQRSG
jgi:hypothetical protein